MVEISASFESCDRCGAPLTSGRARVTNEDGMVTLCYDPQGVTCYDWHLLELDGGTF